MNPEVLSHAPDCQCPGCRAFFWELFLARDEREILNPESLGVGPLEPEGE